ncbi:hypothetical protein [Micromonospora sp. URMC 103]|uniref:hypothetical protein n=1 Tax=Micromonospora sp. URMC 103 TaxID=3423406 RepID=UPI003F19C360
MPPPTALALGDARPKIAAGLDRACLFWIESHFTDLAEHAAAHLPDVTISRDLIPATDGLVVWSRPITPQQITAVSWTSSDDGWQLVKYRTIGGGLDATPLQRLREQVGWLAPIRAAHVHETQTLPSGGHPAAALVATWLLVAQKAADITEADVGKALRKRYARTNRPAQEVRIVRIRAHQATRTPPRTEPTADDPESGYRSRFWVSGHWRNQPYGPGRSLRRPVYISPFLRGPDDAPIILSTTVRVLRSHRLESGDHR